MYARVVQTLTLVLVAPLTLVSATPTPIDALQANVIAENRNMACSGPQGCIGASGAATDAYSTSGATQVLSGMSYNVVLGVTAAGGLSLLSGIL